MQTLHKFDAGGYAFLEGGFPYSQGVIALPGHAIERVRFLRPMPVAEGFDAIREWLGARGRPLRALCAAELRSPEPFSFEGFRAFNDGYVGVLEQWGIYRDGLNPVARSNVCPVHAPPTQPGFHAFSYTVPSDRDGGRDFVVAGSGEWPEDLPFPEGIVARGDLSADGLGAKIDYVVRTMAARCQGLGGDWQRLSAAQVYTAHDFHAHIATRMAPMALPAVGLDWQVCRPPIVEIEFEMDVRSVATERLFDR